MIEILELPWGYGYRVDCVYQEYDPECEGFIPMTKQRAEEMASIVSARIGQ